MSYLSCLKEFLKNLVHYKHFSHNLCLNIKHINIFFAIRHKYIFAILVKCIRRPNKTPTRRQPRVGA